MKPKKYEQFNSQTSEQFSNDLKALFKPKTPIDSRIDRAVMDQAALRLHHRTQQWRWRYWIGSAAAAAIVVAGLLFLNFNGSSPPSESLVAAREDIDRDGTVNILDAFQLAKQISSGSKIDPKWDTNGDGVVDQKDVDTVAMAAVKLNEGVL